MEGGRRGVARAEDRGQACGDIVDAPVAVVVLSIADLRGLRDPALALPPLGKLARGRADMDSVSASPDAPVRRLSPEAWIRGARIAVARFVDPAVAIVVEAVVANLLGAAPVPGDERAAGRSFCRTVPSMTKVEKGGLMNSRPSASPRSLIIVFRWVGHASKLVEAGRYELKQRLDAFTR